MLKEAVLHSGVDLAHADAVAEVADRSGRVAASAQTADRGHTRIVPSADGAAFDQRAELALTHDRVVDAQSRELDLARLRGQGDVVAHPVVQRSVILELEAAQAVGDVLHRVLDGVGKVIHRVDAPLVTGAVMVQAVDAVDDRIAHVEVARREVDLRAQGHFAVLHLAVLHLLKEGEALFDRAVTVGGLGWSGEVAAVFAHLLGG